jgi:hypothetical protein
MPVRSHNAPAASAAKKIIPSIRQGRQPRDRDHSENRQLYFMAGARSLAAFGEGTFEASWSNRVAGEGDQALGAAMTIEHRPNFNPVSLAPGWKRASGTGRLDATLERISSTPLVLLRC